MSIFLYADIRRTVEALDVTLRELARNIELLWRSGYLDPIYRIDGWEAVFGKVSWPMAHFAALQLVANQGSRQRIMLPQTEIEDVCESWRVVLAAAGPAARRVIESEFEARKEPRTLYEMPPDADLDHVQWILDVWKLSTIGSDAFWPELRLEARLDELLLAARGNWLKAYPQVLRDGGFKLGPRADIYWPLTMEDLRQEEIPWLPESWWWRRLPELLAPLVNGQRPATSD